MNPEIYKVLKEIFEGFQKILALVTQEEDKKYKSSTLIDDIASEVLKPTEVKRTTTNPFTVEEVRTRYWGESELKSVAYCADEFTPKSKRTLEYLLRILPKEYTEASVRSKLRRLGYVVRKGVICQK
jgi:hypothetical protein|uniref:Uncharacterized protein n=1 Tax=Podoviridae sp. ctiuS14 TaxID=2827620 RepID=A0A8S5LLZ4_9CAUD|nr:MAG TPA: hypothetical protein [Podoviridae sp. ctiuS14]